MPEEIVIQEKLVENGLGERIIHIYFALFHIPTEIFLDEIKSRRASSMARSVQNDCTESSFIHNFEVANYGRQAVYASSPNRQHTKNICEALLESFEIEYVFK